MTGLIPFRDPHGNYRGSGNWYFVPATDSTAIFIGDPVALAGSGDTEGHYATVAAATLAAGNAFLGPVVGVSVGESPPDVTTTPDLENKHRVASVATYVFVADDPDLEFLVGEDAGAAAIVAADIGNLGILIAGTGETAYGQSGDTLDSSSFDATTTDGQIQLLGVHNTPGNDLGSSGVLFRVKINGDQHQLAGGS
jgi:hypothetical protein